jgi:hypothetical protein
MWKVTSEYRSFEVLSVTATGFELFSKLVANQGFRLLLGLQISPTLARRPPAGPFDANVDWVPTCSLPSVGTWIIPLRKKFIGRIIDRPGEL